MLKQHAVVWYAVAFIRLRQAQISLGGVLERKFKIWRRRVAEFYREVAFIYDFLRICDGFGDIGEKLAHLRRRLDVKLMHAVAQAVWIVKQFVHRDTHENLVRVGSLLKRIVRIVCCDYLDI